MKTLSLSSLKNELAAMPQAELVKVCIQLAKYKKENKELLGYLLFDSNYEPDYINRVREEIDLMFAGINKSTIYFAKKSIRKILRYTNKYIRYSGQKRTEVELRIHFCVSLMQSGIPVATIAALNNILQGQMVKIDKAIAALHEDLQHDYREEIKRILPGQGEDF
jgi:hypothetical protein